MWVLLGLIGPLSFIVFLGYQFGDPFVFYWGRNVPGWAQNVTLEKFFSLGPALVKGQITMDHVNVLFGFMECFVCLMLAICRKSYANMVALDGHVVVHELSRPWALFSPGLSFIRSVRCSSGQPKALLDGVLL